MVDDGRSGGDGVGQQRAERWVQAFLRDAGLERDLAPATREAYRRDLGLFVDHLRGRDLSTLETPDLVGFLGARARQGDGPATQARRGATLRSFFGWLVSSGRLERNPTLLLPGTDRRRLLPKGLSHEDAGDLVQAPDQHPTSPRLLRDHAVLEFLYGGGLRASEAACLRLGDIDFDQRLLRVTGKRRKERRVPLGDPALHAMETWLRQGRPALVSPSSGDALLLADRGRPLTRDTVYRIVKRWVTTLGLDPHTSPHTLRHSFATHLVQGGADLRSVQELLGHASIDTTQVYTSLADQHLRDTHRRFHPRA
jgi:site-specific recombinase XerD